VTDQTIDRVAVVGAGRMGAGIAEVCALARVDVLVWEPTGEQAADARARIIDSLGRAASSGTITEREREQAVARLRTTDDLADLADRPLIIEAVTEDRQLKTGLFRALDGLVTDPDAVLASTTSSIPIAALAAATDDPGRVLGMHFFHPVPLVPLVELVSTPDTAAPAAMRAEAFARQVMGKEVVRSADEPGFIANALLVPFLLSAVRMVESGRATAEEVDTTIALGPAHRMGPLRLADLLGLDTVAAIADRMHAETGEALYAPPPLLRKMVASGCTGRRAGRGFYRYTDTGALVRG